MYAAKCVGRSGGTENPSVKSDEPESEKASRGGSTPRPQLMPVNPAITSATHTNGRVTSAIGAYIASERSRSS